MAKAESPAGLKTPLLPPRPPTPPVPRGPTPPVKPVFTLPTATDLAARKKGLGARSWLRLDCHGNSQLLEADKYAIMRRCGIPARDLRILDPLLAYPSTILGRESAIVVNLEAIKAIITADEVLLLNPMDAAVLTYTEELQRRLQPPLGGPTSEGQPWLDGRAPHPGEVQAPAAPASRRTRSEADLGSMFSGESGAARDSNERGQPFEFRALEMALEMACSQLHHQSEALEAEAFPALDELTSKISTLNLERVRRLKSRLMALTVRVQKMRDEVEQLLDDDDDMAEMYLTEKQQKRMEPPPESPGSAYSGGTSGALRTPFGSAFTRPPTLADGSEAEEGDSPPRLLRRDSRASRYSSSSASDEMDVEELEMLLEAYFVQIDGITNKLNALKNYIDDTEDYINLQLDNHRNQLLQLEIVLTIATFVMAMFSVVAGVFGMNIPISLFHEDHSWAFKWVLIGSGVGGLAVFSALIAWIKYNNLIN